jgi:hypothetical protein
LTVPNLSVKLLLCLKELYRPMAYWSILITELTPQEEETRMMASSFTKAFRLTALVLVVAVAQVYVMAGPVRTPTDPRANNSEPKAETVVTDSAVSKVSLPSAESQLLTPAAAAERMPLSAGSKSVLNRIFSKRDVEARLAAGNTFLKAKTSGGEMFKAPGKRFLAPQDDDDEDSSGGGSKGAWIAVGVIAAVLTVAIIGLRHDRGIESVQE